MTSLYFQIAGLSAVILIIIVFFSKERIKSKETKIFSYLLISSLMALLFDIAIVTITYLYKLDIVYNILWILNKFYLSILLVWAYLFTEYIFNISVKEKSKLYKIFSKGKNFNIIFNFILIVIVFLLPIQIYNDNNVMYSYGASVNFIVAIVSIYVLLIIVFTISNIKKINNKKYIPLFVLIILAVITILITQIDPGILLTTAVLSYIILVMFFTIENPDLKLIEELNFAKDQAEKANNAKSDFLSNMSHEIRTPLNAIVGFSQALSEEDIPDIAKEEVGDIVMASKNLLEIVNGILDISKIEANKLEIINKQYNINDMLDELVSLTKARMGDKPLEFKTTFDRSIPPILFGDHLRVKQIILNLLTNAVKYTKKGHVEFKVDYVIKNNVCRLIVSVEDSGIGIKPQDVDKLFTKFQRFDMERNTTIEGTGLGLAITKKLVELMGGQIVVHSVYNEGSKFTVAIDQKIVIGAIVEKKEKVDMNSTYDATGKKILIVDDNKINLKVARRLLQTSNALIDEVLSGQECIDKIKEGIKYDLILLDDMMPKMSGVETLKKLKEIESFDIPTIAFTANAISGMREKYLNDGFNDYLSKPIEKTELNEVLNRYLKGE